MAMQTDEDPVESVAGPKIDETAGVDIDIMPEVDRCHRQLPKHVPDAHLAHERNAVMMQAMHRGVQALAWSHGASGKEWTQKAQKTAEAQELCDLCASSWQGSIREPRVRKQRSGSSSRAFSGIPSGSLAELIRSLTSSLPFLLH
jgi:hypothetical protein